jgi:hypothetical protein
MATSPWPLSMVLHRSSLRASIPQLALCRNTGELHRPVAFESWTPWPVLQWLAWTGKNALSTAGFPCHRIDPPKPRLCRPAGAVHHVASMATAQG